MKGIILAGGKGTRLMPLTAVVSKTLLPVYDKPMIYYPLSTLMMAGIKDILIISTKEDLPRMQELLGDGSKLGIKISFAIQEVPKGIVDAFLIGEEFIKNDSCMLILGDNIFYGASLKEDLMDASKNAEKDDKAYVFAYPVKDPKRFGIVELSSDGKAISIEEKPNNPKTNLCVTGLYIYPSGVAKYAKTLKPSLRGELEITDLNNIYLNNSDLYVKLLNSDYLWIDAGTFDSLLDASLKIKELEEKTYSKIGCIEEVAFNNGWISKVELLDASSKMNNSYGNYLKDLANKQL